VLSLYYTALLAVERTRCSCIACCAVLSLYYTALLAVERTTCSCIACCAQSVLYSAARRRADDMFLYRSVSPYQVLSVCCSCTAMYVGEYCQYMNPCHTGPGPRCQNGGSCNVRSSPTSSPTFWCTCPIGYSASLCEIPVANSCDSDPCLNGGTCTLRSLDSYSCTCAPGYTGQHCELQDHCASTPCRNGAECESLGDTYKCSCAPGFVGPSCAEDIVECKEDPCQHGTCYNTHGSYK